VRTNLNDEKAARNHDAAIETAQWDWYALRSYNPNYQSENISKYHTAESNWDLPQNKKAIICHSKATPSIQYLNLFNKLCNVLAVKFSHK
jgi:hypothetical protein